MATKKAPFKKVAMVAPPPSKFVDMTIEEILSWFGNDRPYHVLDHQGNSWKVHFEGDTEPKMINFVNGKWVIK